jgi:hypothetical protein
MITSESRTGSTHTPLKALCGETTLVSKQAYFCWATSISNGSNINGHATSGYSQLGTYKNQVPSKSEIALWFVNRIITLTSFLSCVFFLSVMNPQKLRLRVSVEEQSETSCGALLIRVFKPIQVDRDLVFTFRAGIEEQFG